MLHAVSLSNCSKHAKHISMRKSSGWILQRDLMDRMQTEMYKNKALRHIFNSLQKSWLCLKACIFKMGLYLQYQKTQMTFSFV